MLLMKINWRYPIEVLEHDSKFVIHNVGLKRGGGGGGGEELCDIQRVGVVFTTMHTRHL